MRRILLKLSGEALAGDKHMGFDEETVRGVALQVKKLVDEGYEIGIVTGGGNFWRGRSSESIDGVYNADPAKVPDAKKYDEISIDDVIAKNLQVVDMTASILARDNRMPMWVFGLNEKDSIVNTMSGKFTGTKVTV